MQNVGLDLRQYADSRRFREIISFGPGIVLQPVDEIPALFAQRRQQRVADGQILFFRGGILTHPGQIALGQLSDRIGREPVWAIGSLGFVGTYVALLALPSFPSPLLLWTMVLLQGALGYGVTSVFGAIPAEIFEGRHYGSIFGTLALASIAGGAVGPWLGGLIHDATGSYAIAFWIAIGASVLSIVAIYRAAPGKVRAVAGRMGA